MAHGDIQSVLRCGLCNKPFDKREPPTLPRNDAFKLTFGRFRVHTKETWVLLSVSKDRRRSSPSILRLLYEGEDAMR